jgi:thymidylate synthase (FAD)
VTEINFNAEITAKLVDYTGSDRKIAAAARVSTLGDLSEHRAEDIAKDRGLIRYLMRERHGSPFEHTSMTFLVRAPIFVAREFMRHRAGWSYNEESGRYTTLRPDFYMPEIARRQTGKPGHYVYEDTTDPHVNLVMESRMVEAIKVAWYGYEQMLNAGIAREVARMVLPVQTMTSFYATCNARSLMHFLSLRTIRPNATYASCPQLEIQMVADQMEECFEITYPDTHAAFNEFGRVAP